MTGRFERIAPDRIVWGETMCSRQGCVEPAVLAFEGWPYCLDHGDDSFERAVAFELAPDTVRAAFPGVDDR